jgi:hypothetical protein
MGIAESLDRFWAVRGPLALAVGVALSAACVSDPPPSESPPGVWGGWTRQARPDCRESLVLSPSGRFALTATLELAGLTVAEQIEGRLEAPGLATGGEFSAAFWPDSATATSPAPYCAQWQPQALPGPSNWFATATGEDLGRLTFRTLPAVDLGTLLVGSNGARQDVVALFMDGTGSLRGFLFTDPKLYPAPLYYAPPQDPARTLTLPSGPVLVNLPDGFYAQEFPAPASGTQVAQLYLNVTAAVDISFSKVPGAAAAPCDFAVYADLAFTALNATYAQLTGAEAPTLPLNPAANGQPFLVVPIQDSTAYLLPIGITTPGNGPCSANIRAIPTLVGKIKARAGLGNVPDAFTQTLAPGRPYLVADSLAQPGRVRLVPLGQPGYAAQSLRLAPWSVRLAGFGSGASDATAFLDVLNLAGRPGVLPRLVGTGTARSPLLSVYPAADASAGLGPFGPSPARPSSGELTAPSIVTEPGVQEFRVLNYRLHQPAAGRLALWTEGGAATTGRLEDELGRLLALNTHGSPDGAGFRIVRTVPAGEYRLEVRAASGFTLRVESAAPSPFADEALEGCLVEAGLVLRPTVPLREAYCGRRGIIDLTGLDALGDLQSLDLSDNAVQDLAPLHALIGLTMLVLTGNRVSRLGALSGLGHLRSLSLAGNPVDPADLEILLGLAGSLRLLNLNGVTSLTVAQVDQLRALMPNTLVIGPDGK